MPSLLCIVHDRQTSICLSKMAGVVGVSLRASVIVGEIYTNKFLLDEEIKKREQSEQIARYQQKASTYIN